MRHRCSVIILHERLEVQHYLEKDKEYHHHNIIIPIIYITIIINFSLLPLFFLHS
jgi:hypothetical protein